MPILHMETMSVRATADQFLRVSAEVEASAQRLNATVNQLSNNWHGGSSDMFVSQMGHELARAQTVANEGAVLADRLQREVSEWEATAASLGVGSHAHAPDQLIFSQGPGIWGSEERVDRDDVWWHPANLFTVLAGMGRASLHNTVGYLSNRMSDTVQRNDKSIDNALSHLLKSEAPGANESVLFLTEGDGIFNSIKVKGGSEVQLTRQADGTYEIAVSNSGLVGPNLTKGGKLNLAVGKTTLSESLSASGEVLTGGAYEVVYAFDPKEPGDMTMMALLLGTLGTARVSGVSRVIPGYSETVLGVAALPDGLDNLKRIEFGRQAEASTEFSVSKLIELVGGEVGVQTGTAVALEKNRVGQWEVISDSSSKVGADLDFLISNVGGDGEITGESILNPTTGEERTRVTIDLRHADGLSLRNLDKLISTHGLETVDLGQTKYEQAIIEYEIEGNYADIGSEVIRDGAIIPGSSLDQAKVTVKLIEGTEADLAASVDVGVGVAYGLGGKYTVGRESEQVYIIDPVTKEWHAL